MSLEAVEDKVKSGQRNAHIYASEQLKEILLSPPNKQTFEKAYQYLLKLASNNSHHNTDIQENCMDTV